MPASAEEIRALQARLQQAEVKLANQDRRYQMLAVDAKAGAAEAKAELDRLTAEAEAIRAELAEKEGTTNG